MRRYSYVVVPELSSLQGNRASSLDFHEIKQDVMLKIADIVARHSVEIALPARTVYLANGQSDALPRQ
jgi:hypothetical protein